MERTNNVISAQNNTVFVWDNITEADTPEGQLVPSGKYTLNAEGAFGGGTIEFQYSRDGNNYHSIDATNLTFSDNGSYNIEIGQGYLRPTRSGGAAMDVNAAIIPIPTENK